METKISLTKTLAALGAYSVVDILWEVMEMLEFGKRRLSISDAVIGILIYLMLYREINRLDIWRKHEQQK